MASLPTRVQINEEGPREGFQIEKGTIPTARKIELIVACGGKCNRCGYARNLAALAWHHLDPALKGFNLDVRSLSNRNRDAIDDEIRKCILLCANCHAEIHFPDLDMESSSSMQQIRDHFVAADIE